MTTDQLIGKRVAGIMFDKRVPQTKMSRRLGITQSTLSKKLHGDRPWSTEEVYQAARLLKASIEDVLPTMDEVLPHLDSNQEPFGYRRAS